MHPLIVFVAGPYRAPTISGVRANIERARAVAEELWAAGYPAFCPHLNSAFMDGVTEDRVFLAGGLLLLERCDRVVLVPGWLHSLGSHNEVRHAVERGLPVYANVPDMLNEVDTSATILIPLMDANEPE